MSEEFTSDYSLPVEVQAPPHNRQAEEAVLGAVLVDAEVYFDVAEKLNSEYL